MTYYYPYQPPPHLVQLAACGIADTFHQTQTEQLSPTEPATLFQWSLQTHQIRFFGSIDSGQTVSTEHQDNGRSDDLSFQDHNQPSAHSDQPDPLRSLIRREMNLTRRESKKSLISRRIGMRVFPVVQRNRKTGSLRSKVLGGYGRRSSGDRRLRDVDRHAKAQKDKKRTADRQEMLQGLPFYA